MINYFYIANNLLSLQRVGKLYLRISRINLFGNRPNDNLRSKLGNYNVKDLNNVKKSLIKPLLNLK